MSFQENPEFEFSVVPQPYDPRNLSCNLLKLCGEINELLPFLSSKPRELTPEHFGAAIGQDFFRVVVCRDKESGKLVGMASIYFVYTLLSKKGYVEDVVVHGDYRGRGLGKLLMQKLLELAQSFNASGVYCQYVYVELTSSPVREAANLLYQKLGFVKREANIYRLNLG